MESRAIRYVCHACGAEAAGDESPFVCPSVENSDGDDRDHVLRRIVHDASEIASFEAARTIFLDSEPNPFRRYAPLAYSRQVALEHDLTGADYLAIVDRLDAAVREVDGSGFRETPCTNTPRLAAAIGLGEDQLWVKDETGNVSGSHKGRHLMGSMIWLEARREWRTASGVPVEDRALGIASCGNAALAAGVIAHAAERPLEVFVPLHASPPVVARLDALGATITRCERRASDPGGDPCYLRFVESTHRRVSPFTVQGNRCGLAMDGGATLGWEIVSTLLRTETQLDHLVVQVGGGGLASACMQAFREARAFGLIDALPRIHTVQTQGGFPLRRAYDRIVAEFASISAAPVGAADFDPVADDARARSIRDDVFPEDLADLLLHAATHRSDYMWSWETPPESIAYGILDDETYDWVAVVEGMLETGGIPLVVSEECLARAHALAHEHTDSPVEPTGTAGLAGLIALVEAETIGPDENAAVLFTGRER